MRRRRRSGMNLLDVKTAFLYGTIEYFELEPCQGLGSLMQFD